MKENQDHNIQNVYRQIVEISKKYQVKKVVLFGSRARGTNMPKSDIDLAIYGCADFGGLSDMQILLERYAHSEIGGTFILI